MLACTACQVIVAANNLLSSEHARSKLPAAELLAHLAPRAEYSSKVADVALGTLALALMDAGPGWAGAQKVQHHAAQAIKALIENIQVCVHSAAAAWSASQLHRYRISVLAWYHMADSVSMALRLHSCCSWLRWCCCRVRVQTSSRCGA